MTQVFIAIFLVMAVLIYFISISLRIVTENANKKVNTYFLNKLGEFDKDFKQKMNKLEDLQLEKEELQQQIKALQLDRKSLEVSVFYKPRPVIRDTYIPLAHYIDNGFFEDYKKAKRLLTMDKEQIIRNILERFPYEGDMERYLGAQSILDMMNPQAIFDLCTLEVRSQLEILREALQEENQKKLFLEFLEPLEEETDFSVLDFKKWLTNIANIESPYLNAYIGEEGEVYPNISEYVICRYDKNVCEGIRIIYQGKLYDYSIYESRKKNERIY